MSIEISYTAEAEAKKKYSFETKHIHCTAIAEKAATGGQYSYSFTPTSIGTCVWMKCNVCKAEQDITDYSTW